MATIKEEAEKYESMQTRNIADLDKVPVDVPVEDDEFTVLEEDGKERVVKTKVAIIENEKYRLPLTVLKDLKVFLQDNPDLKYFKVKKSGVGKKTEYTTIPILKAD